ncbi:MAG: hypothetical protein ABR980_09435 [Ignavibacteriaceae bacterium]|jgi:hypothetical protein
MPNTYPSPVNPLAVIYTAGMIASTIGQWLNKENMEGLDPEFVKSLMNLAILNVAETISGAGGDDYGKSVVIAGISSNETINISGYPILNIVKIVDSINYECIEVGSKNFDNLYRFPEKQNKTYWYKHGQYLYFYVGANVTSVGTRTMSYNSYPQRVMNDGDFLDIRDAYVPLVIDLTKSYCIEHLGGQASADLTTAIANKTAAVRQNILTRQQMTQKNAENNQ